MGGCRGAGRKTKDVDFGVTLADWDAYAFPLGSLERSGRFRRGDQTQRMLHLDTVSGLETSLDLVPFGAIADATGTLSWPPDGDKTMRVLGYEQALAHATMLKLDATRALPMASPAGLAILKLVAWLDRGLVSGGKDAVDFMERLYHQEEILSDAELYDEFPEALDAYDYRPEPVAAWILGRRVADCMTSALPTTLKAVFQKESTGTWFRNWIAPSTCKMTYTGAASWPDSPQTPLRRQPRVPFRPPRTRALPQPCCETSPTPAAPTAETNWW